MSLKLCHVSQQTFELQKGVHVDLIRYSGPDIDLEVEDYHTRSQDVDPQFHQSYMYINMASDFMASSTPLKYL